MIDKIKNLIIISFCVFSLVNPVVHAAPSASLSIASGSYPVNSTFSVTIYENSDTHPVNIVQVDLKYDATLLEFQSIDASSSAFSGQLKSTGGSGNVNITRYAKITTTVTGNAQVATVVFKALPNASSASITFASSSAVVSASTNKNIWNGVTTGASFSFTVPPPVSTPPPASVPPPKIVTTTVKPSPPAPPPVKPVVEAASKQAQTPVALVYPKPPTEVVASAAVAGVLSGALVSIAAGSYLLKLKKVWRYNFKHHPKH